MLFFVVIAFILFATSNGAATGDIGSTISSTTTSPQTIEPFIPHKVYPYAETYPNSGYDNYLIPLGPVYNPDEEKGITSQPPITIIEYIVFNFFVIMLQTGLAMFLKTFTRISLYVVGTAAAILIGALFTSLLCTYTPFCTLTFNGFRKINPETVRSLVNVDNISAAASFVQDAVDKYQRLQRGIKY
ncbi:uncharacterized protein [Onthophagus taurus]|uniref:uncharacterized protein n=1 Tax=Onthophagus taurus TaxID=166361 RepID=UPI0039BE9FB8